MPTAQTSQPFPEVKSTHDPKDGTNETQPLTAQALNFGRPGDQVASHGGSGTSETLELVKILSDAGIQSCAVGTHALRYYGAGRIATSWELCVPTEELTRATQLFEMEPHSQRYERWPNNPPLPESILHTCPRFHLKGVRYSFFLVPANDYLLQCDASRIERSWMGIPYPTLPDLAQSLLDTQRWNDLTDLVDGMDLSEEWGEENLRLDRTCDVEYAQKKNALIRSTVPETPFSDLFEISPEPRPLRPIWLDIVRDKKKRIGVELDQEFHRTRFYLKNGSDPRLQERYTV